MTRRGTRFVTGLLVGVLLLAGCDFDGAYDLPLPGSPVDASDGFEITADFEDVLNVVPRSPVMVDDVVVGEVTEVERVGWHAKVTLRVRNDVRLPDDTSAEIRQVSLLGEKYVALVPPDRGGDGRLGAGDHIALDSTGRNPEVEEVLGALSFLLSGGGVAQLGSITREVNLAMNGRQDKLKSVLGSLRGVVATVDDQKVDIINAMESLDSLAGTLNKEKKTIGDALDAVGPAVKVLSAQHEELIAMLGALEDLGRVGARVIRASKDDLLKVLGDLEPVLSRLSDAGDELGPGLNLLVSFPFPKEAGNIVHGDYANTTARIDIDFDNFLKAYGIELPKITLPDPGELLDAVGRCLRQGSLASAACQKVFASLDLLKQLKRECRRPAYAGNHICRILAATPDLGSLLDKLGISSTVRHLQRGLTDGEVPVSTPSVRGLLGGATT